MIEKVKQTIIEHNLIQKGDCIVAGVSGGPDSVCLLHVLSRLREQLDISLHAVHVNHMIRGAAADEDQRFTEGFCAELDIPCHVFRFDIPALAREKGLTSEEAGREARYEAFFKVLHSVGARKIAVAQNLNDQAETVLLRLLRGTGTDGLAGIEYLRDGVIIRPLLDISREEIERYCDDMGLAPRIDLTNLEPLYARNRIRLELLPLLKEKYNANIVEGLGRLAGIAREDSDFIRLAVDEVVARHAEIKPDAGQAVISRAVLAEQHPSVAKRVIMQLFASIGLVQDITAAHLDQAMRLILMGGTSKAADFPDGYFMTISYGRVRFADGASRKRRADGLKPAELGIIKSVVSERDGIPLKFDTEYIKCFDHDSILASNARLELRTRRGGDLFSPLGMKGTKKLKEFFIDEKIPSDEREKIPLVCAGNDVVWIVGFRMSEKYKVTPETKRVLILEYRPPV